MGTACISYPLANKVNQIAKDSKQIKQQKQIFNQIPDQIFKQISNPITNNMLSSNPQQKIKSNQKEDPLNHKERQQNIGEEHPKSKISQELNYQKQSNKNFNEFTKQLKALVNRVEEIAKDVKQIKQQKQTFNQIPGQISKQIPNPISNNMFSFCPQQKIKNKTLSVVSVISQIIPNKERNIQIKKSQKGNQTQFIINDPSQLNIQESRVNINLAQSQFKIQKNHDDNIVDNTIYKCLSQMDNDYENQIYKNDKKQILELKNRLKKIEDQKNNKDIDQKNLKEIIQKQVQSQLRLKNQQIIKTNSQISQKCCW